MVESIAKLRKTCQNLKRDREKGHLYAYLFAGRISIYITKILLYTKISANQVTFLNVLVKIAGALLLIREPIFGVILLQLGYILDRVDGEIARYRKSASLTGRYWDVVSSYITEPFVLLCVGIRTQLYIPGIICSFSLFLKGLAEAVKYEMLYEGILHFPDPSFTVHSVDKATERDATPIVEKSKLKQNFCNAIFGSAGIMNIITISAFAGFFFKSNLLRYLLIFYTCFLPYFWIRAMYNNFRYTLGYGYKRLVKSFSDRWNKKEK